MNMLRQYELVERVKEYAPDVDEDRLNRAYVFTVQKHGSQKRASGDPYFSHPIEVAGLMTDLKLDEETIITALLHDTVEDTLVTIDEVETKFGSEVARLVDGVTKLSKIEAQTEDERAAENLRKFLLAISDDLRVLLVKLADRLHNMRTLHYIPKAEKRRRIARETMDIYAPLAERVGMYEYMREMQLLSFEQLEPSAFKTITKRLKQIRGDEIGEVNKISEYITEEMAKGGLSVEVSGREKHPYSIWRKMEERHIAFEQLTDINAFRIITESEEDCYKALWLLHKKWKMLPGRFKDYISTPKRNGYRSLHTTIMYADTMRVEVQIRSADMHRSSEFGLAAHWSYKQQAQPDGKAGWIRDLIEILDSSQDAEEFLENTRMAMYQDRLFAFSPKGTLYQLPKGATCIDFAFAVHTDLGSKTVGAKVNGRHVPLRTILSNGDMVEILTSEGQEPQPNWLNFAVTGKASASIRRYMKNRKRDELVAMGRQIFEDIVNRIPETIGAKAIKGAITRLNLQNEEDMMYKVGSGLLQDQELIAALAPELSDQFDMRNRQAGTNTVSIRGLTSGLSYNLGECCNPIPGDRIVGLRIENQPVEVHTIDCHELVDGIDNDWIDLSWGNESEGGAAKIRAVIYNRPGMLAEVANIFGHQRANIMNLRLATRDAEFHTFEIDAEVHNKQHLMKIISSLRASDSVVEVERV